MYECGTKLDTEKHGYDGLARIIPATEGAQLIRSYPPNPPNSRSIFGLQKNGRNAETCAVSCAERFADARAVIRADEYAELGAVGRAVVRAGAKKRAASAAGVQSSNFSLAIE